MTPAPLTPLGITTMKMNTENLTAFQRQYRGNIRNAYFPEPSKVIQAEIDARKARGNDAFGVECLRELLAEALADEARK